MRVRACLCVSSCSGFYGRESTLLGKIPTRNKCKKRKHFPRAHLTILEKKEAISHPNGKHIFNPASGNRDHEPIPQSPTLRPSVPLSLVSLQQTDTVISSPPISRGRESATPKPIKRKQKTIKVHSGINYGPTLALRLSLSFPLFPSMICRRVFPGQHLEPLCF